MKPLDTISYTFLRTFLRLLVVLIPVLAFGCERSPRLQMHADEIKQGLVGISKKKGKSVWSDVLAREWDTVCYFGPYATDTELMIQNTADGSWTIVFLRNREVVGRLDNDDSFVELTPHNTSNHCFGRNSALTVVDPAFGGRKAALQFDQSAATTR